MRTFEEGGRFTLANIISILADPNQRQALWNSLLLGSLVGLCGTALGFLFAYTAVRANLSKAWTLFLDVSIILPLISPPFTTAIAMIFSFGPRGLITYDLLGIKNFTAYGLHSTLFSETITYFPIAYLTLKAIIAGIDPNIEDMAFSLGSSRWRVFRTVTLPLTVPGLANSFLLLFAASLADFATPLILAGNSFPILPTQAYLQITGLFDEGRGCPILFAPHPCLLGLSPSTFLGQPQKIMSPSQEKSCSRPRSKVFCPGQSIFFSVCVSSFQPSSYTFMSSSFMLLSFTPLAQTSS